MRHPRNLLGGLQQFKAVSLALLCPVLYVLISLIILVVTASAQNVSSGFQKIGEVLHPSVPGCLPDAKSDLRRRACFYLDELVTPSAAIHALFSSEFSEWRNSPHIRHQDSDDTFKRFSVFYESRAARDAGELLVGHFHHEDFLPRESGKTGFLERSRAALLSVLVTTDESGVERTALAPIAGSFSSGFVGAAAYQNHGLLDAALRRSGTAYGSYFTSAMFREFKPDLVRFSDKLFTRSK